MALALSLKWKSVKSHPFSMHFELILTHQLGQYLSFSSIEKTLHVFCGFGLIYRTLCNTTDTRVLRNYEEFGPIEQPTNL